jgi:hypothetical protein
MQAAVRCLSADQACCWKLGGYSDRMIQPIDIDGSIRDLTQEDHDEWTFYATRLYFK